MGRSNIIRGMLYSLSEMGRDEEHGLTGDEWWMLYLEEYERTPGNIGAIVKSNVDAAHNDGKIRRFPWRSEMWHLHLAHETPHGDSSSGLARSYHFRKASEPKGKYIMDEMRAELSIKPVDYFNFTGYPATVVR